MPLLIPDLVWRGGAFHAGLAIDVDPATGRIRAVQQASAVQGPDRRAVRLRRRALVPGFINAHSHAFQRLLRGRAQVRSSSEMADFWSWRETMYRVALSLSPDDLYQVARFCFIEMMRAGWTTVGEFHYLHRDAEGRQYTDRNELAQHVITAAEDVGLRICLLNSAYVRGGIGRPLLPEQRRFATPDLEDFLWQTSELTQSVSSRPLVSVGLAAHSLRAVPREWLGPMHSFAFGFDAPLHMHVSEQPAEVAASLDAWNRRPVELLAEEGIVDALFTAVHATHLTHREIALLGVGPQVCACPTTERDLGDGFLPAAELVQAGTPIAVGSDSQTMIAPLEELRLLEYHERLRKLRRVVLGVAHTEGTSEVAPLLLDFGTRAGARALRVRAGEIEPGALADIVAIDLEHPALEGWTNDTLGALLTLCAPPEVVSDVWIAGVQRIERRYHALEADAAEAFRRVASAVFEVPPVAVPHGDSGV